MSTINDQMVLDGFQAPDKHGPAVHVNTHAHSTLFLLLGHAIIRTRVGTRSVWLGYRVTYATCFVHTCINLGCYHGRNNGGRAPEAES